MLGPEHWAVADTAGLPPFIVASSGRGLPAGAVEQDLVHAVGIRRLEDQTPGLSAEVEIGRQ
eukprot:917662-Lingulodinium_polyedra.AAC.1